MKILATLIGGETKEFSNIAAFNSGVLDGEAINIVADKVLSEFHIDDVRSVIKLLITKCHKGAYLKFVEWCISSIARDIRIGDEARLDIINKRFTNDKNRCFLSNSYLESILQEVSPSDFFTSAASHEQYEFSHTIHRRDN